VDVSNRPSIRDLEQALDSALALFLTGEPVFEARNFQAAANEFRAALNGDPHPNWIDAWAAIDLGEILRRSASEMALS
jgi:hypothetical protein